MKYKLNFNGFITFKILIICIINHTLNAKDTPEPAALLKPRNFNPHPYFTNKGNFNFQQKQYFQQTDKSSRKSLPLSNILLSQSPIQFPNDNNLATLPHPYAKLDFKSRIKDLQNNNNLHEDPIQQLAFKALSKHAKRLLTKQYLQQHNQQQDYVDEFNEDQEQHQQQPSKKEYAFSYRVRDSVSGDDFSHTQHQHVDGAVRGSYQVQLPDGRIQLVKYTADNNGYKADVTYLHENVNDRQSKQIISYKTNQFRNSFNDKNHQHVPSTVSPIFTNPLSSSVYYYDPPQQIPNENVQIDTYNGDITSLPKSASNSNDHDHRYQYVTTSQAPPFTSSTSTNLYFKQLHNYDYIEEYNEDNYQLGLSTTPMPLLSTTTSPGYLSQIRSTSINPKMFNELFLKSQQALYYKT